MHNRLSTIARFAVLEALRTRLPMLTAIVICTLLGASFFVREIAIAESARFQAAFYAATIRYAMAFIATLYVIASVSREFQDKGLELALALDLPRAEYVLGKLLGFLAISAALAFAVALPLLAVAGWEAVLQWMISLAAELSVVVALSLFCVITFTQLMPAASIVIAFYFLARAIDAIRLISANPIAATDSVSQDVMRWLVEAVALLVPGLELWTRTAWLVDQPAPWSAIVAIVVHGGLFVTALAAAAVFDLYRKNF
jgi:ABC-type transport system involved in multi-copper enzyme maturation permease subunit